MLDMIFLIAAVVGGTIMLCQFAMTLIGLGEHAIDLGDGDFSGDTGLGDGDLSHGGFDYSTAHDLGHHDASWLFEVVSLRTVVAAAAFFGVAGKAARSAGYPAGISLTLACLVGLAAMYGVYWLMKGMSKLASAGNENIDEAIGKRGTVYVPIGENGVGKVQLTLQNRTVEYQAVAEEQQAFKTGETVQIVQVKNSDTVVVKAV